MICVILCISSLVINCVLYDKLYTIEDHPICEGNYNGTTSVKFTCGIEDHPICEGNYNTIPFILNSHTIEDHPICEGNYN